MPISCYTWLVLSAFAFQVSQSNVIFHFTLDFNVKHPANSTDSINKTITMENNAVHMQDNEPYSNTTAPNRQSWEEAGQYDQAAVQLLRSTKQSVQKLNVELAPLVGRSDELAASLKQTIRYVNEVDTTLEMDGINFAQHMEQLRKYLTLVDNLRSSARPGGVRTLEFVLLKLAMEKYKVLAKYQEVTAYLQQANSAWARYKNTQVVLSYI
ncbi:uncharacterized protein LOC133836392 [Drosophila sulfurigaster albostrigata]|uniref:uncharacterized protein LOC132785604 n=1 Tax=Drosophila nasuta TaxID=42062 RepID=UPI00295E8418|nr:uncharacterized protein LOC132785604 [Drosophila nasuta]XP_062122847.1 uncharacterized protein LOC133836392 [Drosophila sulfurigaster albostrigata]